MLKKLVPDLRFRMNLMTMNQPPAAVANPLIPGDFVRATATQYKLRHSRADPRGNPDSCPVEVGAHAKLDRTFLWIPWVLGKVSYIPVNGQVPVITGAMSGCWLLLFRLNGQLCFGHVGTDSNSTSQNTHRAKNAWKIAVNRGMVTPVHAYNPINYGPPTMVTFGAVSKDNHFYTIGLSNEAGAYKVVATTRVHGAPISPVMS